MSGTERRKRVLVAMSGGVDSSVAAALLVDQGYEVIGVTMQVWDYSANTCDIQEGNGTCCSSTDVDDARAVADRLDIPFYVINCEAKFKAFVIDEFIGSYLEGRTPIPCVNCNTYLKFDHLVQKMNELECDFLATGHYAKIVPSGSGRAMIQTSLDQGKDQTYFLFTLKSEIVKKLMFPIGDLEKSEVRRIAEEKGLLVARKKDSTGICFIGKGGYGEFIASQVAPDLLGRGSIRRWGTGEILGDHSGVHQFTYGQRKGLGVAEGIPLYVVKIEPQTQTVWLGEEKDLYSSNLELKNTNWLDDVADGEEFTVKVRYHHKGSRARLKRDGDRYRVEFFEPQRAITPGQAAVFFRERNLIGGDGLSDLNERVHLQTFGCKVNTYDSGLIEKNLMGSGGGIVSAAAGTQSGPMYHVLNTCAVTEEATRQALREARRLKRENPQAKVVVTGCGAQVDTEKFEAESAVDWIVANSHKGALPEILRAADRAEEVARVHKSNIFKKEDLEAGGGEELLHTRSFLKIQDGCDSFCTFCVIPFARGKSRSIEPTQLARRVREIESRGVAEVVLTGVHIGDYRSADGGGLGELIQFLLKETHVGRIRLSSLEPIELSPLLMECFQNPRICPHFHMSIQSASSSVLRRMKRNYGAGEVAEALERIQKELPEAFVGMDVIAGFAEETPEEFLETLHHLEGLPWTRMHVFPYSSRPLTYASRALKPLAQNLVRERAARLRGLSESRHQAAASAQVGTLKKVLPLQYAKGFKGLSRDYWPVLLDLKEREKFSGSFTGEVSVRIRGYERVHGGAMEIPLVGEVLPAE